MILRFNKETKKLVKEISKKVAKKLKVDKATLCIVMDAQNEDRGIGLCFETDVDDVWANLEISNTKGIDIIEELNGFMKNKKVEWMIYV